MLFKIPELRGRMAYDVRFELYDDHFFDRLQDYNYETGPDWKSFANGYRIVIVDEQRISHTAEFLDEPGARVLYRNDDLTVIARPARRDGPATADASRRRPSDRRRSPTQDPPRASSQRRPPVRGAA